MANRDRYGMSSSSSSSSRDRRPTSDELMDLYRELKDEVFGVARRRMMDDEKFLRLASGDRNDKDTDILRGFRSTHKPFYLSMMLNYVLRAINQLLAGGDPDFEVILPPGLHTDEKEETKHKEEIRNWARALWQCTNTSDMGFPIRTAAFNGLGPGLAILSYPLMADRYPEEPKGPGGRRLPKRTAAQKEEWAAYEAECRDVMPWDIHAPAAQSILFDPDHGGRPEYYFEFGNISRRAAKQDYPFLDLDNRTAQSSGDTGNVVERVIYVSKKYWAVFIDGKPVLGQTGNEEEADDDGYGEDDVVDGVATNTAGYLWYQCAESGFGIPSSTGAMEDRLQGMVRNGRDLIAAWLESFNVMQEHLLASAIWMPDITGAGPDGKNLAIEELGEQKWGLDEPAYHSDQVKIGFVQGPELPNVVVQVWETIKELVAGQFGPEVLSGEYKSEPASKQAQRRNQALLAFKAMESGLEHMVAQATTDMLYSMRNQLKRDVTVWGKVGGKSQPHTMKYGRVPLGLRLVCKLSPMTDIEAQADFEIAAAKFQAGAIDKETFMREGAKVENPQRMTINIMKDQLRALPGPLEVANQIMTQEMTAALQPQGPLQAGAGGIGQVPAGPAEPLPAGPTNAGLARVAQQAPQPQQNGAAPQGPPPLVPAGAGAGLGVGA